MLKNQVKKDGWGKSNRHPENINHFNSICIENLQCSVILLFMPI